jgi:hypothetical protein
MTWENLIKRETKPRIHAENPLFFFSFSNLTGNYCCIIHNSMKIKICIIIIIFLAHLTGCIRTQPEKTQLIPISEYIDTPGSHREEPAGSPDPLKNYNQASTVLKSYQQTYVIGVSAEGTPLVVTEIGTGEKTGLVLVGSIHGNEKNTGMLVSGLESVYKGNHIPDSIPSSIRLFFLPVLNPDGVESRTRRNAHNVDLNRNFPTNDWKPDAVSPSKIEPRSGGTSPGSEPEVRAITSWLMHRVKQTVESVYLISFHSAYPPTGSVQPGYRVYGKPGPESVEFAQFISRESGYNYLSTWITSRALTGEFIHWCEMNDIWSCDIELPDYNSPSTIPAGKKETTLVTFKQTLQEILTGFFIDS